MPKISTYSTTTPSGNDLLLGTDANNSSMTKNFLISDLAAYFLSIATLEEVLAAGNTSVNANINLTNGSILTGGLNYFYGGAVVESYLAIADYIYDFNGDGGFAGDVLSSTGGGNVVWKQMTRGSFYSTVNQSALSINTAYPMQFNNTDTSVTNGVSIASSSRLTVNTDGVYNVQFSAQLDRISGSGTDVVDIWFRKNGVDIPNSNTKITMTGNANACKTVAAWNFMVDMSANSYVEIMWSTTSTNIELIYEAVTAPHPATPSVIATINKIS
jgi:hypothetical protein